MLVESKRLQQKQVTLDREHVQAADRVQDHALVADMVRKCASRLGKLEPNLDHPQAHEEDSVVQVWFVTDRSSSVASRPGSSAATRACRDTSLRKGFIAESFSTALQMLRNTTRDLSYRIICAAPVSLLRLLLILPPSLHAHAIQARTCATTSSGSAVSSASLCLADAKDLPPASTAAALEVLASHVSQLSGLAALRMTRMPSRAVGSGATLARIAPLLSALTSLKLARCALGAVNGSAVVRAVPSLHQLEELDLSGNELGSDTMPAFEQWTKRPLQLTALNLADNAIDSAGLLPLQKMLWCTPYLQRLDISGNTIRSTALHHVADDDDDEKLTMPPIRLRDLCMSSTDLLLGGDDDRQMPELTRLHMRTHLLDHDPYSSGWETCVASTQLQEFVGETGLIACPGDQPLRSLTSLTLCIADSGTHTFWAWMLGRFLPVIASMPQLRALALERPDRYERAPHTTDAQALTREGGMQPTLTLQGALQFLTSLSRLHIGPYFAIVDEQAAALLAGLSRLRELRVVAIHIFVEVPALPVDLTQAWCGVTSLELNCPKKTKAGIEYAPRVRAAALRSWLRALPQLQHFSMRHEIQHASVCDAPALPALTHLRLSVHVPRGRAARACTSMPLNTLQFMLATATTLLSLELMELDVKDAEVPALFRCFASCTQLTQLRLAHVRVEAHAQWVECAARSLRRLPHLRHLSLSGCALHQSGEGSSAEALCSALLALTGLQELELAVTAAQGLPQLVCALAQSSQRLQSLRLWLYGHDSISHHVDYVGKSGKEPAWAEEVRAGDPDLKQVCSAAGVELVWIIHDDDARA